MLCAAACISTGGRWGHVMEESEEECVEVKKYIIKDNRLSLISCAIETWVYVCIKSV